MRFRRRRNSAEDLDDWDEEGQGFAGAGGCVDGDVFEAAEQGDCGGLNRRAELEASLGEGFEDRMRERRLEVGESRVG